MTRRDFCIWTLGLLFLLLEIAVILFIVHKGKLLVYFCAQETMCP